MESKVKKLVERLRAADIGWSGDAACVDADTATEGANEIERLHELLQEAATLLQIAHYAHQKMGLEGQGNRGLPHETRMFAMHFSEPETPRTPEHIILAGDGRFRRWWAAYKALPRS
jgi:hypothetical protein